jgi:transcriptional regulator with XRE-family HTH domain
MARSLKAKKTDAGSRSLVARNVRTLRVQRGLSQEQLAAKARLDRSHVTRIESETGPRSIGTETLDRIARALEVPTRALFAEA